VIQRVLVHACIYILLTYVVVCLATVSDENSWRDRRREDHGCANCSIRDVIQQFWQLDVLATHQENRVVVQFLANTLDLESVDALETASLGELLLFNFEGRGVRSHLEVDQHVLDEGVVSLRTQCRFKHSEDVKSFHLKDQFLDIPGVVSVHVNLYPLVDRSSDFFWQRNVPVTHQHFVLD